ncbi:MAG: hypothetical protein JNL74_20615, partial [Fibrobacteres bacterium]|nr:hypothetical protein [Fibrobacterota bacterium]
MLKFLLLVLAFNLIGFFLERMKRNAQKKKQMEYDEGRESVPEESYEEEPPTPPVVSTPDDILGDFFKKLETSTTQKQQPAPQEREESLEEPAFGRVPSYKEYDAREYNAKEYEAKEYEAKEYEVKGHAKMQDGRSLIELMESKQQNKYDKYSGFDSHSNEPVLGA